MGASGNNPTNGRFSPLLQIFERSRIEELMVILRASFYESNVMISLEIAECPSEFIFGLII